ncbi:hypothetical protein VFPBJ_01729 [Purpureocillium lilacinum]|uniref:Uncharacterized protein n=1 Tax=Purpureocillium lilacinum TaxID=33203 RepID=A0A179HDY9_PURLI|nr:hypothetical protein VFPBJ_01729 [Purpureocillium lilacinum]
MLLLVAHGQGPPQPSATESGKRRLRFEAPSRVREGGRRADGGSRGCFVSHGQAVRHPGCSLSRHGLCNGPRAERATWAGGVAHTGAQTQTRSADRWDRRLMKELVWAKLWLGRKKHDDTYLTYIMLFAKDGCVYDPESIICQRNIRRPRLIDSTRGTSSAGTRRATRSRHAILIPSHRSSSMRRASLEPGGHRSSCPPPPPHRTLVGGGGGGGEWTMARQGIGKQFFFFLRCLCGREHGPQMKRLVTITNECFERVSAFFRQDHLFPSLLVLALGGWDNQRDTYAVADAKGFAAPAFAPTWDARIAAGICWCRAAWHSALQGCRNGGAARREWAGWDCRAELDGVGGRARQNHGIRCACTKPAARHCANLEGGQTWLGWLGWPAGIVGIGS